MAFASMQLSLEDDDHPSPAILLSIPLAPPARQHGEAGSHHLSIQPDNAVGPKESHPRERMAASRALVSQFGRDISDSRRSRSPASNNVVSESTLLEEPRTPQSKFSQSVRSPAAGLGGTRPGEHVLGTVALRDSRGASSSSAASQPFAHEAGGAPPPAPPHVAGRSPHHEQRRRGSTSVPPGPSPRLAASGISGAVVNSGYAAAAAAMAVSRRLAGEGGGGRAASPTLSSLARQGAGRSSSALPSSPLARLSGARVSPSEPRERDQRYAAQSPSASRNSAAGPPPVDHVPVHSAVATYAGRATGAALRHESQGRSAAGKSPLGALSSKLVAPSSPGHVEQQQRLLQQPVQLHPERLRAEAVILRADVSRLTSQVSGLESDLTAARERAVDAEARARLLARRVASLEAEDANTKQELMNLRSSSSAGARDGSGGGGADIGGSAADALRADVGDLRQELASLGRDLAAALKGREEARAELSAVEAALRTERGGSVQAAHAAAARASSAAADIASKQRALEDARAQMSALRVEQDGLRSQLAVVRSEHDALETHSAAARADKDSMLQTMDDLRAQARSLESQLIQARADKERATEQALRSAADLQAQIRTDRQAQQRSIDMLQDAAAKVSAAKSDRDALQRSHDAQIASLKSEHESRLRSLESQVVAVRSERDSAVRASDSLQLVLDDARRQAAEQADRDANAVQAAQAAARTREADHMDAQTRAREDREALAKAQSELESERQRRQAAEWAVEQARVDLERSTQLHCAELQAVSAAADRRIDALQAEITRLDRSLASAGKLGDELRAQLASAEARSRATASAAKVVEEQLEESAERLALVEATASKLPTLQAAVTTLQEHVAELQATGERRASDAARDLRLCQARARELEETGADAALEARELRVELEHAQLSNQQFRDVLENEHARCEALQREVDELRAAPFPHEVVSSLAESRDAIEELTRNLREQEAVIVALRAECGAYRDSAGTASDAAHGAMVAALRAQRAAGGLGGAPQRTATWGGGSSASVWSNGSLSPSSATASRVLQSGEAALASAAFNARTHHGRGHPTPSGWHDDSGETGSPPHSASFEDRSQLGGVVSSAPAAAAAISRLRGTIATRDATIASLRSECAALGGQIAALQAELAVYRKVDVYSVTLHKEMKALSTRHASGVDTSSSRGH